MKFLGGFVGFFFISTISFAQWAIPGQMRTANTLDQIADRDGFGVADLLYGVPVEEGDVSSDHYLDKKWNMATVLLYESDKMIEAYPVKYDVIGDALEIKARNGIKKLDARKIKSIVWLDSITSSPSFFINGKEYVRNGVPFSGFVEVMSDGPMPLLKKTNIWAKRSTYESETEYEMVYSTTQYFYSKGKEAYKVGSKKNLLAAFGDATGEIESYIRINKLDVSKPKDLQKTFEYYNSKYLISYSK